MMKVVFCDSSIEQGKRLLVARGYLEAQIKPIDLCFGYSAMRNVVLASDFSADSEAVYLTNAFEVVDLINSFIKDNYSDWESIIVESSVYLSKDGKLVSLADIQKFNPNIGSEVN